MRVKLTLRRPGAPLTDIVVTPLPSGYAADFSAGWRVLPDAVEEKRIHHWEMLLGEDGQVYLRRMVVVRAAPEAAPPPAAAAEATPAASDAPAKPAE